MTNSNYLQLISTGELSLSIGDRIEYNRTRDCTTGVIKDINGRRHLVVFDDGTEGWFGRDNLSFIPTAARIERMKNHYRETNHELGGEDIW